MDDVRVVCNYLKPSFVNVSVPSTVHISMSRVLSVRLYQMYVGDRIKNILFAMNIHLLSQQIY